MDEKAADVRQEQQEPLIPQPPAPAAPKKTRRWLIPFLFLGFWLLATHGTRHYHHRNHNHRPHSHGGPHAHDKAVAAQCPQVEPLLPVLKSTKLDEMDNFLASQEFRDITVERVAGAIRIPSESYDNMGVVGEDERWDIMFDVADYLEKTFPKVYSTLTLEKVNTHGLLYTWKGSDEALKPVIFMAHQDVVPVDPDTVSQWEHPPWSGDFDGKYIWGRGAVDCKDSLIGILESIEHLIEADFKPKRTILLSFGFDEEISGGRGAATLSKAILERYGKDSISAIVDEGAGLATAWGTLFALPAVGEKGYIDVEVVIRMPGGHSSVPSPHTSIGVASEFIALIEANPYEPKMYPENPFLGLLQCGAAHANEFPKKLKKLLPGGPRTCSKKGRLEREVAKLDPTAKYAFTTSQAVDMIKGGVKANALPERTSFLVNHRVNIGETPDDVMKQITKLASKIAKKYKLKLNAFNGAEEIPLSITITHRPDILSPAPVTPTSVEGTTPYGILAGTTRALYSDVVMSPGFMTGNTDTKYYWDLTKHIFRFGPGFDVNDRDVPFNAHTVNEKLNVNAHIKLVQWYSLFVRNMDEADL